MLNNSQRKTLEQTWELDCAYGLKGCCKRLPPERQLCRLPAGPWQHDSQC